MVYTVLLNAENQYLFDLFGEKISIGFIVITLILTIIGGFAFLWVKKLLKKLVISIINVNDSLSKSFHKKLATKNKAYGINYIVTAINTMVIAGSYAIIVRFSELYSIITSPETQLQKTNPLNTNHDFILFLIIMTSMTLIIFSSISIFKTIENIATNKIIAIFERDMNIIRPFISDESYYIINSRWALMTSKEEYNSINKTIEDEKKRAVEELKKTTEQL